MSEEFETYLNMTVTELKEVLKQKFQSGLQVIEDNYDIRDIVNDLDHEVVHIEEIYKRLSDKVCDDSLKVIKK